MSICGILSLYKRSWEWQRSKDVKTGKKEILPSTAKDKNGKNVTLIYFEKDGKLGFYVQKTQKNVE
ncbi:hypothetical protein ACVXZY_13885 [Staphylococcus aureus]